MPLIYRVWIDVDVFDPETSRHRSVAVDFGPSGTFVAVDASELAAARARAQALAFAERLHASSDREDVAS